mmetsp:Transcript_109459/g.339797  ORF Transcript_109459/g.339797 Transcript_109459/m.339797 type:complete len:113 (+) Transcript_109459:488-826(+)
MRFERSWHWPLNAAAMKGAQVPPPVRSSWPMQRWSIHAQLTQLKLHTTGALPWRGHAWPAFPLAERRNGDERVQVFSVEEQCRRVPLMPSLYMHRQSLCTACQLCPGKPWKY